MQEKMLIKGGNKLVGCIDVQGAKNATLPIMAASILLKNQTLRLNNVPNLQDIQTMSALLRSLGADVQYKEHTMIIFVPETLKSEAPVELVRKMRASSLVLGPLVARNGMAVLPLPGGCVLGSRPLDFHFKGLTKMGATIELEHGSVYATAKDLKGAKITLDFPSVGATENLMMAATLAKGTTLIENAALEPEIQNLADVLRSMGAKITGDGTNIIKIIGQKSLCSASGEIIPDRIEAATYLLAGLITKGSVTVSGIGPNYLEQIITKLEEANVSININNNAITASWNDSIRGVSVKTLPHPGFPTDIQPQLMALLSLTPGTSVISESVFDSRLLHVDEFKKMGAKVEIQDNVAIVTGVSKLTGATVHSSNLRAGAALILMGLAAEGETVVCDLHHVWRGYENMVEKLLSLGAKITLIDEE